MKMKVKIGRLLGMKVYLHSTFAILVAYYLWDLSWESLMFGAAVVASLMLHELAHAGVARMFGNVPIRITFHGLGACVRLRRELGNTWRDALIAFAGPASNLLAGAVAFYCARLFRGDLYSIRHVLCCIAVVNGVIAGFNLLPAYPLDGGRLFRWLVSCLMKERHAASAVLCAGVVCSVAYVALGCSMAFDDGSIMDLCVQLPVAILVVVACWIEFDMTRKGTGVACSVKFVTVSKGGKLYETK